MRKDLTSEVASVIKKLNPLSQDFVIVGGVSTFLYDFHPLADRVKIKTTFTQDIDIAVPGRVPKASVNIEQEFAALGYSKDPSFLVDSARPLIKYSKELEDGEIEIEFLVPLMGAELNRDGTPKTLMEITTGVIAQQLRYLDILIDHPTCISLENLTNDSQDADILLKIPNPANYLLHKFITLSRRSHDAKKEKDAFYLYDVLNRFKSNHKLIGESTSELIKKYNKIGDVKNFKRNYLDFFNSPSSEGIKLFMREYNRTYIDQFKISENQVVAHFMDFINYVE